MRAKKKLILVLVLCMILAFLGTRIIAFISFGPSNEPSFFPHGTAVKNEMPHKLAVLVPFRDRFDELLQFAPHMHHFLNAQNISHKFYILNQADRLRFNRGALVNVGHLLSRADCDYLVIHDVDLLPLNPRLSYGYPAAGPRHLAAPHLHPRYHYASFLGGILLLTSQHFRMVNGLSNQYWGWGMEDDEFHARLKVAQLNISRPQGITSGTADTFLHLHDRTVRKRDTTRLFNQKQVMRRRDHLTGLTTVKYEILKQNEVTIDDTPVTVFHIKLECDYTRTPWCDHRYAAVAASTATTAAPPHRP